MGMIPSLSWPNPIGTAASSQADDTKWNPASPYNFCYYFWFWWNGKKITINGVKQEPIQFVASVFPGKVSLVMIYFFFLFA